jgi:two-component sensor histidine kinase
LEGPELYLPAQQATACALIINELLQNAVEHGLRDRAEGTIVVRMAQDARRISITVKDDGWGLPPDFNLERGSRLGLRIVQTLVQDDLKGRFLLESGEGVRAGITFPVIQLQEAENGSI